VDRSVHGAATCPTDCTTAPTIQGSVDIRDGRQVRFRYYFNHNALKDCVRVGNSLIALTESGNLIRFDAETLRLQGQAIIPGRGTAIAPASNRVLIGTEDGRIYGVDPASLLKAAPTGVFDAIADSDGWVLLQPRRVCFVCVWKMGNANPSQVQASARRSKAFAGMSKAGCGLREDACTSLPMRRSGGTTSSFLWFLILTRSVSDQTRWLPY
jgi:hypothetical protein